jgi:hypothetical protein
MRLTFLREISRSYPRYGYFPHWLRDAARSCNYKRSPDFMQPAGSSASWTVSHSPPSVLHVPLIASFLSKSRPTNFEAPRYLMFSMLLPFNLIRIRTFSSAILTNKCSSNSTFKLPLCLFMAAQTVGYISCTLQTVGYISCTLQSTLVTFSAALQFM